MALERAHALMGRNEHLTFRANMGVGRHGWLRLTPAYGVKLVRTKIEELAPGSVVIDPFSGTGTTPLAAAELGHFGQSIDVNPFLVWLGNVKTDAYSSDVLCELEDAVQQVLVASKNVFDASDLWQPNLFKIEKWWSQGSLHALKALRFNIDNYGGRVRNLLDIAFCRTLIGCSNAAFNHQSMSFKEVDPSAGRFEIDDAIRTYDLFRSETASLIDSARFDLPGKARVFEGDSREGVKDLQFADLVLTSPPYVNRMSYIRELRPYMYWLRYLDQASDAGDLDWRAIGGTWGTATSKLKSWEPSVETPVDAEVSVVAELISRDGGKNGPLLATYVRKYHHDMWQHFESITPQVKPGGEVSYIIGNSTFYNHEVPAHEWYADMLRALGYQSVRVDVIRKRNSNKALFEYDVSGVKPS